MIRNILVAAAWLVVVVPTVFAQTHPRLFFDAADLPGIRAKLDSEPYKSMFEALQANKDLGDFYRSTNESNAQSLLLRAEASAFLYALTGLESHATDCRTDVESALTIIDAAGDWANSSLGGLTSYWYASKTAICYDLCYDSTAWDATFNADISSRLLSIATMILNNGGSSQNQQESSNWQANRAASGGLALLACDETYNSSLLNSAETRLNNFFTFNQGNSTRGWNPEGSGYTAYALGTFVGPYAVALDRLEPARSVSGKPGMKWMMWASFAGATTAMDVYGLGGVKTDWSDDNAHVGGEGVYGLAFRFCPPELLPGLRHAYDRFQGSLSPLGPNWDAVRHGTFWSILYYPDDIPAQDPLEIFKWQEANVAPVQLGVMTFRDGYRDENDILVQFKARTFQVQNTHDGADGLGFRILGPGDPFVIGGGRNNPHRDRNQATVYPTDPNTSPSTNKNQGSFHGTPLVKPDGGGHAIASMGTSNVNTANHKRWIVTDFDRAATGADATVVIADTSDDGAYWQLPTFLDNSVEVIGNIFTITGQNGATLQGTIIHPGGTPTVSVGTKPRGDGYTVVGGGTLEGSPPRVTDNRYLIIENPSDGDFLVVMTIQQHGGRHPVAARTAGGVADAVVEVGSRSYTLQATDVLYDGAPFTQPDATVTFEAGPNGSVSGSTVQVVSHGGAATPPTVTPDPGFAFAGWDKAFDEVAVSMTVSALFEADPGPTAMLALEASSYRIDEDAGTIDIGVTRSGDLTGAVGVSYTTADGSATAGADYTTAAGTLSWAANEADTKFITISLTDDGDLEGDESFTVTLSSPTGGAVLTVPTSATVEITDDEVLPPLPLLALTSADYAVAETAGILTIDVARYVSLDGPVGIDYAVSVESGDLATAGDDFTIVGGTLNWADAEGGTKSFNVPILDDSLIDPEETFTVTLSNPTGGALLGSPAVASVTIDDDEIPAILDLSASSYTVGEAGGTLTITVTRTGNTAGAVSADYGTTDGSAAAGSDFTGVSGTLNWADGDSSDRTFDIPIIDDGVAEGGEDFEVFLTVPPATGSVVGPNSPATVTLSDDEIAGNYFNPNIDGYATQGGIGPWNTSTANFWDNVNSVQLAPTQTTNVVFEGSGEVAADDMRPSSMIFRNLAGDYVVNNTSSSNLIRPASVVMEATAGSHNVTLAGQRGGGVTFTNHSSGLMSIGTLQRNNGDGETRTFSGSGDFAVGAAINPGSGSMDITQNTTGTLAWNTDDVIVRNYFLNAGTLDAHGDNSSFGRLRWNSNAALAADLDALTPLVISPFDASSGALDKQTGDDGVWSFVFTGGSPGMTYVLMTFASTDFSEGDFAANLPGAFTLTGTQLSFTRAASGAGVVNFPAPAYSVGEADGSVTVSVERLGGIDGPVSVDYATSDGSATTGDSDYTSASGTLNWADGEGGVKTFDVTINNDAAIEPDEEFTVTLSNPVGGVTVGDPSSATVTITTDDSAGTLQFETPVVDVDEGSGTVTLTVTRTGGAFGAVSVDYASSDGEAVAGSDFTTTSGTLNWADGDSASKTFDIPIIDDTDVDPSESFSVTLTVPTGGAVLGVDAVATIEITDNEVSSTLLLLDDFDGYAAGNVNGVAGAPDVGSYAGNWSGDTAGGFAKFIAAGLTYPGLTVTPGALEISRPSGSFASGFYNGRINPDGSASGNVIYFSALLNVASGVNGARFGLDLSDDGNPTIARQSEIGFTAAGNAAIWNSGDPNDFDTSSLAPVAETAGTYPFGTTYLMVARIEDSANWPGSNDRVTLWLNPVDAVEANNPPLLSAEVGFNGLFPGIPSITLFAFQAGTNDAGEVATLDELKIGGTFADVVALAGASSAPDAASGLAANAVSGSAIQLSWSDNSDDETGFKIQRSEGSAGPPWVDVATTSADATTFEDSGLDAGTTYHYQVIATNTSGDATPSNGASATTWTPIESWRDEFFDTTENSGDAADDFDFDLDGLDNLVEYALGLDPKEPDGAAATADLAPDGRLTISFARDPAASDVTITVEGSNGLDGSWDDLAESVNGSGFTALVVGTSIDEAPDGGLVDVTITDPVAAGVSDTRFMRVSVTRP